MDEKQQRILTVAVQLFLSNGFRKTSVQDIAEAAGVSKATIYKYYTAKEALGMAAAAFMNEDIIATVYTNNQRTDLPPLERLKLNILLITQDTIDTTKFIDSMTYAFSPEQRQQYWPLVNSMRSRLYDTFVQCLMDTFTPNDEPAAWDLALAFYGMIREAALLAAWGDDLPFEHRDFAEFAVDCLAAIARQRQGKSTLLQERHLRKIRAMRAQQCAQQAPPCQDTLLQMLQNQIMAITDPQLSLSLLETLELLEKEYACPTPRPALAEALCLYLAQQPTLRDTVSALQKLYPIQKEDK